MTEEEERAARQILEHYHTELQRIEAEHRRRMAALNRKFRRFLYAWGVATALLVLNILTINEPVITHLYQLLCAVWAAESAWSLWRNSRKGQPK